jgi:hypothetical protein
MDTLRFSDALAAYAAAYDLEKDPALLYDQGRAFQLLGDYPNALARFEQFEATAPPEVRERVRTLPQVVADLRARVTSLVIVCDVRGAQIRLRDKLVGVAPLAGPVRVNAGKVATLEASADGYYPFRHDVDLPPGGTAMVEITLRSKQTHGVLVLQSPITGALASLDGQEVGSVPVEKVVLAGPHNIALRHEGYEPVASSVVVGAGDRRVVTLSMDPEPTLVQKWWFWVGLGTVVVAGVAITAAALTERPPTNGTIPPYRVDAAALHF